MRFTSSIRILVLLLAATVASMAQTSPGEFTVITLPDTQNYSEYYPQILTSQTQWIADNAKSLNIQFVLGLGDVVNDGSSTTQYANADTSYRILDTANIPYMAAIGNHDYQNAIPMTRNATVFNSYFGPARYAGKSYYQGNFPQGSNENFYGVFNVNGTNYLVMDLEFIPRDSALAWASNIIAQNQDKQVMIVTHGYLTPSGLRQGHCDGNSAEFFNLAGDNDADAMWSKLFSKYSNIIMVLNGHDTGYAYRQDLGQNGNLVNQIVTDYQDWADGGGGYLRIMTFKPASNQIAVTSYSPYYNKYLTDAGSQFTINITKDSTTATTGGVAGIVRNQSTCAAIPGVTVSTKGGQATSNSTGNYQTTAAPAVSQIVTAAATGWAANPETLKVDAGYTAQENYYMVPAGSATGAITINAPAAGTNVTSPVAINASGTSSAGAITTMEVYDSDTLAYTTSGSSINASVALTAGGHELTIQGSDAHGNWFKNIVNIVVQQTGSVTMTSPQNNQDVFSPISFTGSATSAPGITAIDIYEDGKLVYTTSKSSVNTTLTMTPGVHVVVMQAFDASGNIFKNSATITVNEPVSASAISVDAPAQNASVASPVSIVASATAPSKITAMQVYEDNNLVYQTASASLNTSIAMTTGTHNLAIKAWDATGENSLVLRTITVK